MSNQNYITEILELKDKNVFFYENCYYKEKIKEVTYKIFEGYLSYKPKFCPKCGVLFDEFKSVKTADGAMSFHMFDGITGQTIDIVEDRRLDNLIRYFFYYNYKARSSVKYIIIDKFHLTQLVSRAFNKTRNYKLLKSVLINPNNNISSYMKTAVKTLSEFLPYIKNTFTTNYHNGYIEGNNNLIKVIKRIAFGFRSFRRFKARIMISKGLIKIKKVNA